MPIFFFNSLRNPWVGTDGKWEAAKGKKMVLEWSAEPGAPLQARPRGPRWCGPCAPGPCCLRRAPYRPPAPRNRGRDQPPQACLFTTISLRAAAQHATSCSMHTTNIFKKQHRIKKKKRVDAALQCYKRLVALSLLYMFNMMPLI